MRAEDWKAWEKYGEELGNNFLQDRSAGRGHCSFLSPLPYSHKASRQALYLRLHQQGSHCLPYPSDSIRLYHTKLSGPPKMFPVVFPCERLVLTYAPHFSKFSPTSSVWLQQATYCSVSCPRTGTSRSQSSFVAWPLQGPFKTSINSRLSADQFMAYAVWPQTEHSQWLTLDMPVAVNAQLQEDGIHSLQCGCTLSTQFEW